MAALLSSLRRETHACSVKHLHSSAAFLADKIVTLSCGHPCDVLLLAQAYFDAGSYRRALHWARRILEASDCWPTSVHVFHDRPQKGTPDVGGRKALASPGVVREALEPEDEVLGEVAPKDTPTKPRASTTPQSRPGSQPTQGLRTSDAAGPPPLDKRHVDSFKYLAAKCYEKLHEWEMCLALLETDPENSQPGTVAAEQSHKQQQEQQQEQCFCPLSDSLAKVDLHAPMCLLHGKAFEALGNQHQASFWYTAALHSDPHCFEAWEHMLDSHMLTLQQEVDLVASLRLPSEEEWLRSLYSCKAKLYGREKAVGRALAELDGVKPCVVDLVHGGAMMPEFDSGRKPELGSAQGQSTEQRGGRSAHGCVEVRAEHANTSDGKLSGARQGGVKPGDVADVDMAVGTGQTGADVDMKAGDEVESNVQGSGVAVGPFGGSPLDCGGTGGVPPLEGAPVSLSGNLDVEACKAELEYHNGNVQDSYDISKRILEQDPYHVGCLPTHVASALHLGRKNDLFLQAHRLAQEYPKSPLAWYTVACYYLCTKQYDQARRFFSKATGVGPTFAPGWLGFGHAYAVQDETDQAMVAYRTAAKLFTGCHLPLLCIGSEYQRFNNLPLAQHFLEEAKDICPKDPLVHNELGVVAFINQDLTAAESHFQAALALLHSSHEPAWEPIYVNLGHVFRKQRKFESALAMYEHALGICPRVASTFSAMGYTFHLMGETAEAIEYYHKALGLRPDDYLSSTMLSAAVAEEMEGRHPLSFV